MPREEKSEREFFLTDIANDDTDKFNEEDSEPSISVNPSNPKQIAVVAFSGNWGTFATGERVLAPVWKSSDGGRTWTKKPQIPPPPPYALGPNLPSVPLDGPADQQVFLDPKGKLSIVALGQTKGKQREAFVYHQENGPDDPLTPGEGFGTGTADQPQITNDAQCQNVMSVWLQVESESSMLTTSPNAGKTVTNLELNPRSGAGPSDRTTRIAVSPSGEAYIVRKTTVNEPTGGVADVYFTVQRSADCGRKWSAGTRLNGDHPVKTLYTGDFCGFSSSTGARFHARSLSSDAWIAAGPKEGEVYVSYVMIDQSKHSQIYIAASADHGKTWTNRRMTDGINESGFPEIAVTSEGTVGVLFVDCTVSHTGRTFRHQFSQSASNGLSWHTIVLQEMDPLEIPFLVENWYDNEFLWGDYEGLTASANKFYGVFTGRSIKRTTMQLDPIFFSIRSD